MTTAICDPHEIANVLGVEGIRWFQQASPHLLMDLRVQLSSCVPSTEMETSGARIEAADLARLMGDPSGIGLAEFMNYPGVIHRDPGAMAKLRLFAGGHVDGHCPQLSGKDLNAYVAAGIRTEHEATTAEEALEKLRKGMRVLIREGSVSKDLDALQPVLTEATSAYMCLCTDDRNPLDIGEHGHLDYMIRRLIALGTPPLAAYRAASLSAAEAFGLKDRGLIAPGLRADIVAVDSLEGCHARLVLCGGRVVDEAAFAARAALAPIGRGSVKAPRVAARDFRSGGQPDGNGRDRHHRGQDHHRAPARGDRHRGRRQAAGRGPRPDADRGDRAARQERQHRHGVRAGLRDAGGGDRLDGVPRPPQHRRGRGRLWRHGGGGEPAAARSRAASSWCGTGRCSPSCRCRSRG